MVSASLALPLLSAERPPEHPPAAPRADGTRRLQDAHGRVIRDLRLSITDRCNFRCVYCLEPDTRFLPSAALLSAEEIVRLARVAADLGIRRIRLTGGEPTLRSDLVDIIAGVAAISDLDVAMTTNGSRADADDLRRWRDAGLDRITFSIDAVEPAAFARLTRSRCGPERVLNAIRAAQRTGFHPIKLNAVVIRGENDDQILPLAGLARELGVAMRYIEFMPLDDGRAWQRSAVVGATEILARIGDVFPLRPLGRSEPSSTAEEFLFADGAPGSIGVVAPVTRNFCGACSRLRITADGAVRPCLFSRREWSIRPLLRDGSDDDRLARFLVDAVWTKQAGHGIDLEDFRQPDRPMSAIGG